MHSLQQLIAQRQSIRHYTSAAIDEADIVTIVEAGLRAPSSRGRKPWQFIIVDTPYLLHQLSECKPTGANFVEKATMAIVLVADAESDTWVEDCSVAHSFMWLQAEALGLGACWVQIHRRTQTDGTPSTDFVREILQIPSHLHIHSMLSIGHPAQKLRTPLAQEALQWEKVHFNGMQKDSEAVTTTDW